MANKFEKFEKLMKAIMRDPERRARYMKFRDEVLEEYEKEGRRAENIPEKRNWERRGKYRYKDK